MPIFWKIYRVLCHRLKMAAASACGSSWTFLFTFFMPILLKLLRCFCHGLKMCMWFGYKPQIKFCHFFLILNSSHFRDANTIRVCIYIGYFVWATPPTVLCRSFWNFTGVFAVVWRCACGLDIILRLFFIIFSHFQFSHFSVLNIIKVFRYWVLGAQLHLQFLCIFQTVLVLRNACDLDIILRSFFLYW